MMNFDVINHWKGREYREPTLYEVTCKGCSAVFLNVVPAQCLDLLLVKQTPLDILWSGKYDQIIIPLDVRLVKLIAYQRNYASRIKSRRLQAIQSAQAHGKDILTANLRCWNCPVNISVERCLEEQIQDQLTLSDVSLF